MAKRTNLSATTTSGVAGGTVNLKTTAVKVGGKRLTQKDVDAMVASARGQAGRPSLTGRHQPSPSIAFRTHPDLKARAEREAARRHIKVSDLAREALEEKLASHG